MWQTIIVVLIVGGAFFFVGRNFLRKLTKNESPACGSCEEDCAAVPELDSLDCQSCGDGSFNENENEDKSPSRLADLSH